MNHNKGKGKSEKYWDIGTAIILGVLFAMLALEYFS